MAPPSNDDGECVCGIEDYNNPNVASWRTNCPSGCALYEYLKEVEDKLNDDWRKVEAKSVFYTVFRQFYVHLGAREQFSLFNQYHSFII